MTSSSGGTTMGEERSEVKEARTQLRALTSDSNPMRKRTVLQRVIALMTMGIDTSSLFAEVILACFTPDVVSKKLIYLFLTTHSERNAELAVLSINTLLKECNDEDPSVRGLALRSLASMKGVPQLYDYLLPALNNGLSDKVAYVRKTAVLCTLLVFRSTPHEFIANGFYDKALLMLRDHDSQVCANALEVLLEVADYDKKWEEDREQQQLVSADEDGTGSSSSQASATRSKQRRGTGEADADAYDPSQHTTFAVSKAVLYHLLNKLNGLNEWQQTQIIDLVHQYSPASEEEVFEIMNALEDRLTGMHSGLILSCCHAFIYLTQNYPTVHAQVLERIRQPLLMLLTCSSSPESSYAVLCHLRLLVKRSPQTYRRSFKAFFCHHNEPTYIKAVKMDILATLADPPSAAAIIEELVAIAEDRRSIIGCKAVDALGRIALRLPETAKTILDRFLDFMRLGSERIRGATLVVMTRFLRRYKDVDIARPFLSALLEVHRAAPFRDEDSCVSLVWVLGEFGEYIDSAPYVLDALSEHLLDEPAPFRLQVLTSAVVLFFKRPPEMQRLLGRILDALANDFSNADVLDRAMMYYRLLREDPVMAARVICSAKRPVDVFVEDEDADLVDKLFFEEFNSLSVVYGLPAEAFTARGRVFVEDSDDDSEEGDSEDDEEVARARGTGSAEQSREVTPDRAHALDQHRVGLLDHQHGHSDDGGNLLLSMLGGGFTPYAGSRDPYAAPPIRERSASPPPPPQESNASALASNAPQPRQPPASPLTLSDDVDLDAPAFQRQWAETPTRATLNPRLRAFPKAGALEDYLEDRLVFTLASGVQGGGPLKLYLFAQSKDSGWNALLGEAVAAATDPPVLFLAEVVVASDCGARVTVKCRAAHQGKRFADCLGELLETYQP